MQHTNKSPIDILVAEGIAPPPALPPNPRILVSGAQKDVPSGVRSRSKSCKAWSSTQVEAFPNVKEEEAAEEIGDQSDDEMDDELQELRVRPTQDTPFPTLISFPID